ncbi:DUF2909 domain-containing protein [Thalassotalea sp. HSM 43]|uniref:DUF2909 domain-containing protein n=1 Tax=Thalassotalea sp. Y01 TaxID=2729613 RepID=UPI00108184DD|nr:DUF2909 domain-containing protein [Thalassotalea sp. HSM 43]NMP16085.1 DUF2909 domain-containing protein [Thalassotalea sp. Y01]QBY06150.1 DUF2909 domain-containing protein [Thalassotalea sp. HSM 43]
MIFKVVLVVLAFLMIYNLFRAGYMMNKNEKNKPPMSKYIGRRVIISGLIVLLMAIGILTGLITPNPKPF